MNIAAIPKIALSIARRRFLFRRDFSEDRIFVDIADDFDVVMFDGTSREDQPKR